MNIGRFAVTVTKGSLFGALLGFALLVGAFVFHVAASFPSTGTGF